MSDFAKLKAQSPFVLERSENEEEIVYTKLIIETDGDKIFKINTPVLKFELGSEHIMYCLDEFVCRTFWKEVGLQFLENGDITILLI